LSQSSIKKLALKGSALELVGFSTAQIIRFTSSLILTRLLFPEAFGLSLLVSTFITGLVLLSDVGIDQSVIQNKRGDQPQFLNTAWTMHVIRGVVLWLIACLLAWPLAQVYAEPLLLYLLPVGALSVVINGFMATSLIRLRRALAIGPLTLIEITTQLAGMLVTVTWAYYSPSVWALVVGGMAGTLLKVIISYCIKPKHSHQLQIEPESKQAILSFGKWIFGSSALAFVTQHTDRLLLAKFMGAATLGIYSIALMLSEVVSQAVMRITHGVLYPVFSRVHRENPDRLPLIYYKARLAFDALGLIAIGGLMMLSQTVIELLYDERYHEAGWMLQALCIRAAMGVVLMPAETCLFALGHTKYGFYQNIGKSAWMLIGMPLSWYLWGLEGVLGCVALSQIPVAIVLYFPMIRLGLFKLFYELRALVFLSVGLFLGWAADNIIAKLLTTLTS
jgi:O-antigen/teichoic acid export membrane protein